MAKPYEDPVVHELMVLATRCRELSTLCEFPALKLQLTLLAEDYEAAIASFLSARGRLSEEPAAG